MITLVTKKESVLGHWVNDLTKEMDTYLIIEKKSNVLETYIYDKFNNRYSIRFPGATRGHIEVNGENVIVAIELYHDQYKTDKIYKYEVREIFKKYIGMKMDVDNEQIEMNLSEV